MCNIIDTHLIFANLTKTSSDMTALINPFYMSVVADFAIINSSEDFGRNPLKEVGSRYENSDIILENAYVITFTTHITGTISIFGTIITFDNFTIYGVELD
jgi:hypothetical protein